MSRFLIWLILISLSVRAYALDADELHLFTDKKGNQITAELLEIAEDQRTAKIRRADGMEFSPEIVLFSLDDQQYIKDWMNAEKTAAPSELALPEMHIEVKIDRKRGSTMKQSSGALGLESTPHSFEIEVSNASRESLEGATIEYMVLWEEGATIVEDEDDDTWTYTSPSAAKRGAVQKKQGRSSLDTLAFNRSETVITDGVVIDRVVDLYGDPVREDMMVGAVARVLSADGRILAETTSGKAELGGQTWDDPDALASSSDPED